MRKRWPGGGVVCTFQISDPLTGVLVDPATVVLTRGKKDDDSTRETFTFPDPAIEHPTTGVYQIEVVPDDAGLWGARIETTDPLGHGASDVYFTVEESYLDLA